LGTITIVGQGQTTGGADGNSGVLVENSSTLISVQDGTLAITGTGGTGAGGTLSNEGVRLGANAVLRSTGDGAISVTGTGGTGGSNNHGVSLSTGSTIDLQGAGGLTIVGNRGGGSDLSTGILIRGTINSTGTGAIHLSAPALRHRSVPTVQAFTS
jgi:hypothetical protein